MRHLHRRHDRPREGGGHHRLPGGHPQPRRDGAAETLPPREPLRHVKVHPLSLGPHLHRLMVIYLQYPIENSNLHT